MFCDILTITSLLKTMSRQLVKLIDASLIPAAVMICGKVLGLWFSNTVFNLNWGILTDPNNFFSVRIVYATVEEQITAASYSNLIMFLCVFGGMSIVLARALFFSSSKISPSMVAKLATNNLLNLMKDSFEIYYQASVWLLMLWLSSFAIGINVLLGRSYTWTIVVCGICTVFATLILLRDTAKEIQLARKDLAKLSDKS